MAALIRPEAMPLIELASATMQTNSGAGLGTVTKWRSTKKATSATAVVNAGPRDCAPVELHGHAASKSKLGHAV